MKRDLDLIRDLLLFYESDCVGPYPDAESEAIRQHMCMLIDANLLDGNLESGGTGAPQNFNSNDGRIIENSGRHFMAFRVTWEGHEFLAAARDDTRWNAAKTTLGPAIGGMSLGLIKTYLEAQLKSALGLDD